MPFCLSVNFKKFLKAHFVQTDLSQTVGIEVMPRNMDLVVAKEVFNHMVLPDAVAALRRIISLRPRFIVTHVHDKCNNTGWEHRIADHLEYTPYDYSKPPFSLQFPSIQIQKIAEDQRFVLYEVTPPSDTKVPPSRILKGRIPQVVEPAEEYITIRDGEVFLEGILTEAPQPKGKEPEPELPDQDFRGEYTAKKGGSVITIVQKANKVTASPGDQNWPPENGYIKSNKIWLFSQWGTLEDGVITWSQGGKWTNIAIEREKNKVVKDTENKKIKGVPAAEFRNRCDLIFAKFDDDKDGVLGFEELCALMAAGGRKIEEYDAYASLCQRLGADVRVGLTQGHVYKLFEKAPQAVYEEVYRAINPLAQMVKKGPVIPETFLERPIAHWSFGDFEKFCKIYIEFDIHLFYGAPESITEKHCCCYFGKQRLEVHIVAPGAYEGKEQVCWKLVLTPLTGEVVPEDCDFSIKWGRSPIGKEECQKLVVKLVKSKVKPWNRAGQSQSGMKV